MSKGAKVPLKRLNVALPEDLFDEVTSIVRVSKRWLSEVDFVRHATSDAVEKWRSEHPAPAGPEPGSDDPRKSRTR